MVSYLFLFLLFLSKIGLVSSAEGNLPPHLSFESYRSILSFANDDDSKLVGELSTNTNGSSEIWDDLLETDGWNVAERNEERAKMKTTTTAEAEADSSSSHFPFILCHFSKSSLCGQERHDVVNSLLSKGTDGNSDSTCGYFLNPVPIYNKNNNLRKGRSDIKKDKNEDLYGSCFYSSIQFSCASQIDDKDILVTPVVPMLKIRKHFYHTTEDEQSIDETTRSLAVILSPGIFSSHEKISEFAYLLQNLQGMDGESSLLSDCDENVFKGSSISVDSVGMTSYFFLEFQSQLSHRCIRLFMEYVVEHPQVLSIEKVAKTVAFNYEAQWITQSSIPKEKPWFEIGLTGKNQIVQVADTGVDLNHCYLKEIGGESVMHTTNWDLTPLEEKIDTTKRKVIQFVRLEGLGDSSDNESGHGTHVVASIVGENLNSNDPLANGVAPDAKICFFDSNVYATGKNVTVPVIISSLFYFGREAGARIHSASWGSGSSGAYSIKSQQIDEYFHDDFFDKMLMFVAGGNEGQETEPNKNRVCDQCVSKNVVCVGASYNNEELRNIVASFSSRGFTVDERIKPDILAPGRGVLSARANSGGKCDPDGGRPPYVPNEKDEPQPPYDGLIYKSGTSMSCPIAAGSGALVRQYFEDGYYPSGSKQEQDTMDISGTLLKAILINGGEKMEKRSKSFEVESLNNEDNFVDSNFYDKYQGFGILNLLKSLKHPDTTLDSPDLFVVNEKEIEQDQTHEHKFSNVCDDRDFRVTLVWRDPPGTSGCTECLVNDLDLEVTLNTTDKEFYPNGRLQEDGPDQTNNVERVILDHSSFSDPVTVLVKVTAANLGVGKTQMYSLVATGCFDNGKVEFDGPDPSPTCDADQFEYTIEVFTNRRPEETSWLFQYQASGGIITAARAGRYDELLHLYRESGCADYGCFLFTIKDTEFNGLCCEKGMGSYLIRDGDIVLTEQGDSFIDRQQTEKFCHYDDDVEEPTTSPTALVCDEDEFKYQIDIETDLYPDETRWLLLRKPRIDGVDIRTYTEPYREYTHEGCLVLGGCYSIFVSNHHDNSHSMGEYTIKANDFVIAERERFYYRGKYEEFCYAGESSNLTPTYGFRTSAVGGDRGDPFDDVHPLWHHGQIVQIELYSDDDFINFIGITYESGQSFEHGYKSSNVYHHIITLGEDQYITRVSGRSSDRIRQLKFKANDGETFGPYGGWGGDPFVFDFGANALVYIFGRADDEYYGLYQLGFAHASLPQTITDSPTAQPTALSCGDNHFRYEIIIRTGQFSPEGLWWELYQVFDSVPFMTYRNQLTSYSHTGCAVIDKNYEFRFFDRRRDGLCCYFGSGSYKLSVDNNVVVRGSHFDDATHIGFYSYPDFVYNKHEFSYSSTLQPTSNPIKITCGDEEFEYRIRVRTDFLPYLTRWEFKYSNGDMIESVEEYKIEYYEYNHRGCITLDECYRFTIYAYYSLCCDWGNGGYTVFADNVVMAEGGEGDGPHWEETKTFCYGPSYSLSPTLLPTSSSHPSSGPLVCDENKFKYEVIVTTDEFPDETSWELSYDDGTIIDSVEQGEYTEIFTEHVHKGCLDLDSCVIFTIFDSWGNGICCSWENSKYTVFANDDIMAQGGGEFGDRETKTFCYGPSFSLSPTRAPQICNEDYNSNRLCGWWEILGLCDASGTKDWMQEKCPTACSNCCMNYKNNDDYCDDRASEGRCTDTSQSDHYIPGLTWQVWMQAICKKSCGFCVTPPPTPPLVCSEDEFQYEVLATFAGDNVYDYVGWYFLYKYPDLVDEYELSELHHESIPYLQDGIFDSVNGEFPPNSEIKKYGCSKFTCYEAFATGAYFKIYDVDTGILLAQNTEKFERLRFCHYTPQPTVSPSISALPSIKPPEEAIFTITITFSTSASEKVEYVSAVVERSIRKILFRAHIEMESVVLDILDYSSCEEFICDISVQVCEESCGEGEDLDFLAVVGTTMNEELGTGELLTSVKQTGHYMDVEIFDNLIDDNPISIEFDFEYDAWPTSVTTSATIEPSSAPPIIQDCDAPVIVQSLFGFIMNIFQPIIQEIAGINDTISDVLFGVESYNSTGITTCKAKMFELQLEIKTDGSPEKTSWELLYENGTVINSIGQDTYSESDTVYNHSYCLDTSCFVFNMFDSFEFKGSYNITVGETVLAQQDSFMWWKNSKRFCYPQCDNDNMFALQLELMTDDWPHETSWDLAFDNGTLVDHVEERYYVQRNTVYNHRYCLHDGCYDVTFHDHIGDGMCCSYGKGSFKMKINYDEVIREGDEFRDSVRKSFCHKTAETSHEENNSFLFGIITDLFGDESCCTTDMTRTGYPTPNPSPFPTSKPSFQPSRLPSSKPSISSNPSFNLSSKPSISSNPTSKPSSNPSSLCNENEFKYEVIVTTDEYPWATSWKLSYDHGNIIDNVDRSEYSLNEFEYVHNGCIDLYSCVVFTIFDSWGNGIDSPGGYTIMANDDVMAEGGGDFGFDDYYHSWSETKTFCYPCNENKFKYEVIVTTDMFPWETYWELNYINGTIIDSVEEGEYTEEETEHVHKGCLDLDSCVIFTIFDSYGDGICCDYYAGNGGYTIMVNGDAMAEGGEFDDEETKTFCYGPSYSFSPSSSPTIPLVCDENKFKYEVIVTTDVFPWETYWELNYINGTLIDSVEQGEYTERETEHVHRGCIDLDSCVIFTIFDLWGDGYTIMANDDVMAEGGGDDGFEGEETHEFCYGPSFSLSPSVTIEICENGSNNHWHCGYFASIGLCEDNNVQDWMQENCAKACSNCCIDYGGWCDYYANYEGRCTDTSLFWYAYSFTWQEWMQATCRVGCDTCGLDFTPSPTPPVTCSDDEFKYEIVFTNDDDYYYDWSLYYKYPEQIDEYQIDGFYGVYPPNYEKRYYGCALYSCFDLRVGGCYVKMYDKDKDILIAQTTEYREKLRFCHYTQQPTSLPSITPPEEAIFTITITFSTSASDKFEQVSAVVERSIRKILFRAHIEMESVVLDILDYSSCEDSTCDISVQVCEESCGEGEDLDFLAVVGTTMNEELGTGELLTSVKQTGHYMDVEIFDNLIDDNPISIEFDFEYDAWPTSVTTSATIEPSSAPPQDCNSPAVVQSLFDFITNIFRPIAQAITNTTDHISDVLFGVESFNSSDIICKDKMFELQLEILTDGSPEKTSWELLYENGTMIESIGPDTYSESDTVHNYSYCLDTSCFIFNMFNSFEFKGSYNITVGDTVLVQQDSFLWWKNSKRFCYPVCDDKDMFALQLELMTDDWPHETSWDLAFDNGTLVDHVDKRYYTGRNTVYNHRYCLRDGCYDVTFHDHIGDGMCCSYGKGSFKMKINYDEVIREGDEFEDSARKSFCHVTGETSDEENNSFLLFGIITDLFGDESCCTTDKTRYPTPVPSPYFSSQPSIFPSSKPSILASSNSSFVPTTSLQPSSNPSSLCNENEFKYEVVVTTDSWPEETSWELSYDDGTIIDGVEEGYYTEEEAEHVHEGCLNLNSCVIFTIFDSWGDGICCSYGNGGYTLKANDVVMAEGGEFNHEETKTFCYSE